MITEIIQGDPGQPARQIQRPAMSLDELDDQQVKTLKQRQQQWSVDDQWFKEIDHSLAIIQNAIITSS